MAASCPSSLHYIDPSCVDHTIDIESSEHVITYRPPGLNDVVVIFRVC